MRRFLLLVVAAIMPLHALSAQHEHGRQTPSSPSRYAELITREIKALAPQDIAALLAGEGMGLALAAELNDHPGPKHVLELAHELGLSHGVVTRIRALQDSMLRAAVTLGERIVDAERRLDRAFKSRSVNDQVLAQATAEIGRLQGELRAVHLRAHVIVTGLLTREQVDRYAVLRGYARSP
jgi:hypothetical protein